MLFNWLIVRFINWLMVMFNSRLVVRFNNWVFKRAYVKAWTGQLRCNWSKLTNCIPCS